MQAQVLPGLQSEFKASLENLVRDYMKKLLWSLPRLPHLREKGRVLRELTYVGLVAEIGILQLKKQLVHAPS